MKLPRIAALALFAVLAGAMPALAEQAITNASANVRGGPGPEYKVVGSIAAGTVIDISGCSGSWCQVNTPLSGYISRSLIASGAQPQPQPQPVPQQPWPSQPQPQQPWPSQPQQPWPAQPQQPWPSQPWPAQPQPPRSQPQPVYEDAGACFFSERDFRGSSFCLDEGETLDRLRTWNDSIRSVQVFGGANVDICSDQNLYGTCATLRRDAGRLPFELDRDVSSIDVY